MPVSCHSQHPEGSTTAVAGANFVPHIWRFGEVGSCLDTAAHLAARGWLEPWDSVQVYSQTAGRGQLEGRAIVRFLVAGDAGQRRFAAPDREMFKTSVHKYLAGNRPPLPS